MKRLYAALLAMAIGLVFTGASFAQDTKSPVRIDNPAIKADKLPDIDKAVEMGKDEIKMEVKDNSTAPAPESTPTN